VYRWDFRNVVTFSQGIFYPYTHICICAPVQGLLEYERTLGFGHIRTYFGSITVESVGVFCHFAFCSLGNRLASFFIVPKKCFLWGASCELITNLATLFLKKSQGFHGTLLYHCYTLRLSILTLYIHILFTFWHSVFSVYDIISDTLYTVSIDTMGWLRLVGSLKLQVSFAEYNLFYRALLQKRPIISRSLLIEVTQYMYWVSILTPYTTRGGAEGSWIATIGISDVAHGISGVV
jgi:hypothetical protein